MLAGVRDPLPDEKQRYLYAVQSRDEEGFVQMFQLYPNVLWGDVTKTLSDEDRDWTRQVLQNKRQTDPDDEW